MSDAPQRDVPVPLRRFAVFVLGYTLFVVLWGAFVRASFSGDGCGDHWPLCHGVVLPESPSTKTIIELTHRVTSGLAMIFAIALPVWARRATPAGHPMRRSSGWVLVLMTTEALVGAAIVVLRKVAHDVSVARGYWMAAHLLNTFLLLAAVTATVYFAIHHRTEETGEKRHRLVFGIGFVLMLIVGMTGAVTALGDTLFPSESFTAGFWQDFQPGAHPFLRLRVFHPILALITAAYLLFQVGATWSEEGRRRSLVVVGVVVAVQVGAGFLNMLLMAPVWLQLVHLALADALWIAWTWVALSIARAPRPEPSDAL